MSALYNWLKNLPGELHLERCSKQFESRGFKTLSSLRYLQLEDIDAFFPSPDKLLLSNAWLNCTCNHAPPPPRDNSGPSGPGVGNCQKQSVSQG